MRSRGGVGKRRGPGEGRHVDHIQAGERGGLRRLHHGHGEQRRGVTVSDEVEACVDLEMGLALHGVDEGLQTTLADGIMPEAEMAQDGCVDRRVRDGHGRSVGQPIVAQVKLHESLC